MTLEAWTYSFVIFSFVIYILIAVKTRAETTGDFYVAGKGVHPVLNGMATAADWMSAASFISMAGLLAFGGYDASGFLMGWTGGYVLLAMLFAPYLRRFGKFTVPEFLGDRFQSSAVRFVAVCCLLFISFAYIAGQMRGVGIVFSRFLGVDLITGLFIGMGIVFFYSILGGMKGITYTQVAQYCILIIAYTTPAMFIAFQMTDIFVPQLALLFGETEGMSLLSKLEKSIGDLGFSSYLEGTKSKIDIFAFTMTLMLGTAGLPHVIVRFFTVPRVKDARYSAFWALLFIAILFSTSPIVGIMARINLIDSLQTGDVTGVGRNLSYEERPSWYKRWEVTGLIQFEDKNADGRIQYYNDQNAVFHYGVYKQGWRGNELVIDRDILTLANAEIAHLPNWVIALVAAGGIAAALSTAAGLLLVISAAISHDILKSHFYKNMSDRQELWIGRCASIVAIMIAGYLGYNPPGFVAEVVALAFGLGAASLFPAIFLGIFSNRVNAKGIVFGMLTGLSVTLGYIVCFKGIFTDPFLENVAENWFLGISPEGFGIVAMVLNFLVAYGVSYATEQPSAEQIEIIRKIHVPEVD